MNALNTQMLETKTHMHIGFYLLACFKAVLQFYFAIENIGNDFQRSWIIHLQVHFSKRLAKL